MYLLGHECGEWTLLSADVIYIPQVVTSARKHYHSQSWKHKTQRPVFQSVLTVTSVIVLMIVNQGWTIPPFYLWTLFLYYFSQTDVLIHAYIFLLLVIHTSSYRIYAYVWTQYLIPRYFFVSVLIHNFFKHLNKCFYVSQPNQFIDIYMCKNRMVSDVFKSVTHMFILMLTFWKCCDFSTHIYIPGRVENTVKQCPLSISLPVREHLCERKGWIIKWIGRSHLCVWLTMSYKQELVCDPPLISLMWSTCVTEADRLWCRLSSGSDESNL